MSRSALLVLLSLGWACSPDLAPVGPEEGSTGDVDVDETGAPHGGSGDDTGAGDEEENDDDGSSDDSTGEAPLTCINLDPAPGDVCYVEHIIEVSSQVVALSDQNGDGQLDLITAQGYCCEARNPHEGLWLLPGNADGSFEAPQRLQEFDYQQFHYRFERLLPMGPGPDGIPRILTHTRVRSVGSDSEHFAVLAGETLREPLSLPYGFSMRGGPADLDGDGTLDFAAVDDVAIFAMSEPNGGLAVTEHPMPVFLPEAVLVGDHDGDGLDDILLVDEPHSDERFVGYWSHTLPGPVPSAVPEADEWTMEVGHRLRPEQARLLDIDDDGRLDLWSRHLASAPSSPGFVADRIIVALGTDDGFAPQVETELPGAVLAMQPRLADDSGRLRAVVNVDGHNDELWLLTLSEELEFQVDARLGLTFPAAHLDLDSNVRVGDLNGDGHSDFVTPVRVDWSSAIAVLLSRPGSI
ncbi:MAG: hypothetical protein AAF799_45095 [Myxococcota bacterium]